MLVRKIQQDRILELLQTLQEAGSEISKQLSPEVRDGLRIDMREFAQYIKQYVESIVGIETETAQQLNNLCDLLETLGENKICHYAAQLQAAIAHIVQLAHQELKPNRIEMVFFPYKRSMADSLQSIWETAMADPACDVAVCPIPYFDRLPNGALGQMHYEVQGYPKGTPIVNWQEYDVKEHRPDVIFIMNPYDEGNYVTSVHPDFYSKNLRKYTDLLVYTPYFVVEDDVPAHFCTTAGCVYAHKVIVQSEKIRNSYVRAYRNAFGSNFGIPEDKFIAAGSAKFDKVLTTRRADCKLPSAWVKLIADKKVILYNTTVSSLLQHDTQYLKKLQSVLDVFQARNDVILWWRPHPLLETTLASMRPALLDTYRNIVRRFLDQKHGIYDCTADLHQSIVWSDALFSDHSSIVALYQMTGKPILLQDAAETNENANPRILSLLEDGAYLWFVDENINALFKIPKNTLVPEYMGTFPSEKPIGASLVRQAVILDDIIYFAPLNAEHILAFSKKSGDFFHIPFKSALQKENSAMNYSGAVAYGKYVYFTPFRQANIMRLDTETHEIQFFTEWLKLFSTSAESMPDVYSLMPLPMGEDSFLLPMCFTNAVLEFNMKTNSSVLHQVGDKENAYSGICYDGEQYWLTPRHNTAIVKWNPRNGQYQPFQFSSIAASTNTRYLFLRPVCFDGFIWVFPQNFEHVLKINIKTNEISISTDFDSVVCGRTTGAQKYECILDCQDNLFAVSNQNHTIMRHCKQDINTIVTALSYPPDILQKIPGIQTNRFEALFTTVGASSNILAKETAFANINTFIDCVANTSEALHISVASESMPETIGKRIYTIIKHEVLG